MSKKIVVCCFNVNQHQSTLANNQYAFLFSLVNMTRTKKAARFFQQHNCSGAAASAAVTQEEVFELAQMQLEVLQSDVEARFQSIHQQDIELTDAVKNITLLVKKLLNTSGDVLTFVPSFALLLAKRTVEIRLHSFTFSKSRLLELYAQKQPQPSTDVELSCIRAETETLKTCFVHLLQEVTRVLVGGENVGGTSVEPEPPLKKQKRDP